MGAREITSNPAVFICGHFPENELSGTARADEHVGPHSVVDPSHDGIALSVFLHFTVHNVMRLVHPAAFFFNFFQDAIGFALELPDISRGVVVVSDEGGSRGEVNQDGLARSKLGEGSAFFIENGAVLKHPVTQGFHGLAVAAEACRYPGHACAAETVEHDVSRLGVVKDVAYNRLVGYFRVVRMGVVDGIVLAFGYIRRKGLPSVTVVLGVVRFPMLLDEIPYERIRASRVVGWVGKLDDIFIFGNGKAFDVSHPVKVFLGKPNGWIVLPLTRFFVAFRYACKQLFLFTELPSMVHLPTPPGILSQVCSLGSGSSPSIPKQSSPSLDPCPA